MLVGKLPASMDRRRVSPAELAAAITLSLGAFFAPDDAKAHDYSLPPGTALSIGNEHAIRADSHGPIGVMGDHMHHAGEWMLSYRYMHMGMEGNRIGDDSVSPDHIVTTVPNRFFGAPMQPPTLRVVPTEMNMDMHMFGAMYAPTDNLTLMAMVTYLDKNMDLLTYQGMMGTTRLGTFSTGASGIGDTKISALYRLHDDAVNHLHLNLGLSLPTGSIDEEGRVLTPMGMRPTMRLPYSMQLGTGTYDLMPGITYTGRKGSVSWGAQYIATLPLESANDEGYAWGDKHEVTAWAAYEWAPWISTSFRIDASTQDPIDGIDPNIVAPVQTANPAFYGGDEVQLLLGANMVGQRGVLRGQRLAFEFGLPVYQDLNGPQMETDWTMTVGWQKSF